jgi:chorismate mutase
MYDEIQRWRAEIDAIDRRLLELLSARADAALRIAACKRAAGLPILDREREGEVLRRLRQENRGPFGAPAIERLFTRILHESRMLQGESLARVPEPLAVAVAP